MQSTKRYPSSTSHRHLMPLCARAAHHAAWISVDFPIWMALSFMTGLNDEKQAGRCHHHSKNLIRERKGRLKQIWLEMKTAFDAGQSRQEAAAFNAGEVFLHGYFSFDAPRDHLNLYIINSYHPYQGYRCFSFREGT
jgi:hypothetical protein